MSTVITFVEYKIVETFSGWLVVDSHSVFDWLNTSKAGLPDGVLYRSL